jgi:hypothetical protein
LPRERDARSIMKSLNQVQDSPPALQADAFHDDSAPSVISRGAEGVTTFPGLNGRNGDSPAIKWIAEELARELKQGGSPRRRATDESR